MVVHAKQKGLSDCRCLLSDREVGRALVVVFDTLVGTLGLDALEHALELTDEKHVLVHSDQGIGPIGLLFRGKVPTVLVKMDLGEGKTPRFAFFGRFDYL